MASFIQHTANIIINNCKNANAFLSFYHCFLSLNCYLLVNKSSGKSSIDDDKSQYSV